MKTCFSIVVAMDRNRIIGNENELPWNIPSDLRRFRDITLGHVVLMGRKTYQSIVKKLGGPLHQRRNIILTRQKDFIAEKSDVVHSLEEVDELDCGHTFVIGGAEIYTLLLPYTNCVYLNLIDAEVRGSSTFPLLSEDEWLMVSEEASIKEKRDQYFSSFQKFERLP